MRIKIYDVTGPGQKTFRAECDLADCFPDDIDALQQAWNDISTTGQCWLGGGAAPAVILERVR